MKYSTGRQDHVDLDKGKVMISKKEFNRAWARVSSVSLFYRIPSKIKPMISRSSSFFTSLTSGRHRWSLLIMVLSFFHVSEGYKSVSMSGMCKHTGSKSLRLFPEAFSLLLDASNSIQSGCRVELIAPETHSISLLFTRRKLFGEKKTDLLTKDESRTPKCSLVVSFPSLRPDDVKMCLDLCSEDAFKSVEHFTDLLPPRVTLEWIPNVRNINEILASEIVVAAVGRDREICSQPGQFSCRSIGYPIYCISKELVCDGKRNCPFEGRDEGKELCSSGENYDKVAFGLGDTSHISRGWEFLASEFLKKLSLKENGHSKKSDFSSSTEKSVVLWTDDGNIHSRDSESLPDVLKHYGPWGYLMLGMLICGTVLMFCGLWECCCRRPKALVSNAVGPALLIINQGVQQNEMDIPSTLEPPRYEELDQPPSYTALFPYLKPSDIHCNMSSTNALPITLPIVNSLSSLRTTSSSPINSSSNFQSLGNNTNASEPTSELFTIDVQNINCLEISRNIGENEPSPK